MKNPLTALKNLVSGQKNDNDINELARAVSAASRRGDWYDGPGSTSITDWITEGDFDGRETVESLAAEWDE